METGDEDGMVEWLNPALDPYERKARLKPGLFCGVPLAASVVLLVPELGAIWGSVGALAVYCGGSLWLIQSVRDRGKALESLLYRSWGGKPSVAMLRHDDDRLDNTSKARYRAFLGGTVPGFVLPSPEEERYDPGEADARLESANRWLLAQTTDHARFGLLFSENVSYGYRRNLMGMKPIALGLDGSALALVCAMGIARWTGDVGNTIQSLEPEWWASLAIGVVHALVFIVYVRAAWVRASAERYAGQLLAACDSLGGGGK